MQTRCVQELYRALVEPENARLKQEEASLSYDSARLVVSEEALHAVADLTYKRGSGARGLQSVLEKLLAEVKYAAPDHPGCEVVLQEQGAFQRLNASVGRVSASPPPPAGL